MRLIDADAMAESLEHDVELDARALDSMDLVGPEREHVQFDKDCKQNCMWYLTEQPTVPAQRWHRVEEPPEPHKDVLVSGMEAINNSRVYKVMVNDNGEWRPKDYAPSILWDYWMPIEPPKEDA